MTFEEQFPSLDGRTSGLTGYALYSEGIIRDFCLDKQRVREVIESMKVRAISIDGELISCNDLLLELGL